MNAEKVNNIATHAYHALQTYRKAILALHLIPMQHDTLKKDVIHQMAWVHDEEAYTYLYSMYQTCQGLRAARETSDLVIYDYLS